MNHILITCECVIKDVVHLKNLLCLPVVAYYNIIIIYYVHGVT